MTPEPLARLREYGLTQIELAALLRVEQNTVSRWMTGARRIPTLVLEDLWELLRLVEERVKSGMDVHQAVAGWQPTVILNRTGPTILGYPIPLSAEESEIAARRGPEEIDKLLLWKAIEQLSNESWQPLDAERLMRLRRIALTVKIMAEEFLHFREGGQVDESHDQG